MDFKVKCTEVWKPINGYEFFYEVSSLGRVRSLGNGQSNQSKPRILKQNNLKNNYKQVTISKFSNRKSILVHRLVAEAFIEKIKNKNFVNHIDENPENNNVNNLQWCTHKENVNYGTRNERISKACTNGKLSKSVIKINKDNTHVKVYRSVSDAGRDGFQPCGISRCANGLQDFHKGYKWKFKK